MEVLRSKDGELYTTCSYQHNVQIDCQDCCNGKLEAAVKAFKAQEIQNGGRRALIQNYAMSLEIGLPDTYGPEGIS